MVQNYIRVCKKQFLWKIVYVFFLDQEYIKRTFICEEQLAVIIMIIWPLLLLFLISIYLIDFAENLFFLLFFSSFWNDVLSATLHCRSHHCHDSNFFRALYNHHQYFCSSVDLEKDIHWVLFALSFFKLSNYYWSGGLMIEKKLCFHTNASNLTTIQEGDTSIILLLLVNWLWYIHANIIIIWNKGLTWTYADTEKIGDCCCSCVITFYWFDKVQ